MALNKVIDTTVVVFMDLRDLHIYHPTFGGSSLQGIMSQT
jgi:hypothetical protein